MNTPDIPFERFPKIPRLNRAVVITEKVDGTNAGIYIPEGADSVEQVYASKRTSWITPDNDNYGFAAWVQEHADDLLTLGPGMHWGEWYGAGIQRRYGLTEKRFALFNTHRWQDGRQQRPFCCGVVPILSINSTGIINIPEVLNLLRTEGSVIVPGFMDPEGIVIYHSAGRQYFKATVENDEKPKKFADKEIKN